MDTQEIDRILRTDPYTSCFYGGTFPIDLLPRPVLSNRLYVVNLDESTKNGSHWVQIGSLDCTLTYFDSFGRPPPPTIIDKVEGSMVYCDIQVQSPLSQACGYHVLMVSLLEARGYPLLEILARCYRAQEREYLRNDAYSAQVISSFTSLPERPLINFS